MNKTVTVEYNATIGQLYQVTNFYKEKRGLSVYYYNVRRTPVNTVKCTLSTLEEAILTTFMQEKGYKIVNKEEVTKITSIV